VPLLEAVLGAAVERLGTAVAVVEVLAAMTVPEVMGPGLKQVLLYIVQG
jgi:hypothetical protein